jgi:hypothetical protein
MQKPIGGRSKCLPAEKRVGKGVGKTIGTYQRSIFMITLASNKTQRD